ncbi:uncharacterized protein PHALS_03821 [Plasmopara halstedii]|uniref:Uncharacterized protein n=1 Tax=Plasmopara halstedii TaxID=4781 RepID=A0A0P1B1C0_PLAHL|nr:uncharacterized protein PHALS_03821 [Plasmopara halstedii]CEG47172.1 hypothetical protein PHALS_03821 [Plasmopara halstedii]|eukprot:XP_024583541.1 hypothetical protein PHALS_03821 [Plasmopara halstedii]
MNHLYHLGPRWERETSDTTVRETPMREKSAWKERRAISPRSGNSDTPVAEMRTCQTAKIEKLAEERRQLKQSRQHNQCSQKRGRLRSRAATKTTTALFGLLYELER